jgi:succinyl-CoA synthetase alpha subunit
MHGNVFADKDTKGFVLIGEIGGAEEERAAEFLARTKSMIPIVALVVGRHAPPERRMGRTGALTKYKGSNPMRNIAALQAAGVIIAPGAHCVGETIQKVLVTSI